MRLRNGKHLFGPGYNASGHHLSCRSSLRSVGKNSRVVAVPKRKPLLTRKVIKKQVKQVKSTPAAVKVAATKAKTIPALAMPPPRRINKAKVREDLMKKFHMEQPVVDMIISTILTEIPKVNFSDIVGQDEAVKSLRERVVYPALNPDLFRGQKVLKPPRGVLLFGPTGNGKTLLAKACASHTHYNFMNVSASALVSKWVGDSEKLVKLLFECAREIQPTIIFLDEIDAMLSSRSGSEREDTRRFKNEFLVHFDGMMCSNDDRVLILGATNLPQCIDSAALRRFDLRVFMGAPNENARAKILKTILKDIANNIKDSEIKHIAKLTEGFSASDLGTIARNAAWLPLGTIAQHLIPNPQNQRCQ
ncbi:Spastin [Hypsibius exemplaris]|uniref:Spastin n=1 Tax=Hypsibius exemplaris TaxID=2072580 RepID=A0A1W0W8W0_HYPEX|nr:Spastin [Hypsibius exemplaris]